VTAFSRFVVLMS